MAKKKFYAVKAGLKPGIYETWDECKAQVEGYSGALYQGFSNRKDAEEFLGIDTDSNSSSDSASNSTSDNVSATMDMPIPKRDGKCYAVKVGRVPGIYSTWDECKEQIDGYTGASYKKCANISAAMDFINTGHWDCTREDAEVIAYVDGSFNDTNQTYGWGVVILVNGSEIPLSGCGNDPEVATMNNVAGEIIASMKAMKFCLDNGYKSLFIVHDYEGTAKFCSREFEADRKHTKLYTDYYDRVKTKLAIGFEWVKGHSKNIYNEKADRLAKQGCGVI